MKVILHNKLESMLTLQDRLTGDLDNCKNIKPKEKLIFESEEDYAPYAIDAESYMSGGLITKELLDEEADEGADERLKIADEVARLKLEAEEKIKLEAEEKIKLEEEAKLKLESEEKIKLEAEEKIKLEAEEKIKLEEKAKLKLANDEITKLLENDESGIDGDSDDEDNIGNEKSKLEIAEDCYSLAKKEWEGMADSDPNKQIKRDELRLLKRAMRELEV